MPIRVTAERGAERVCITQHSSNMTKMVYRGESYALVGIDPIRVGVSAEELINTKRAQVLRSYVCPVCEYTEFYDSVAIGDITHERSDERDTREEGRRIARRTSQFHR